LLAPLIRVCTGTPWGALGAEKNGLLSNSKYGTVIVTVKTKWLCKAGPIWSFS
jgi:hypothetical protein